jgi:hypothetical protein
VWDQDRDRFGASRDYSLRSNCAVGAREAMRPGRAATMFARTIAATPMRTIASAGMVGSGMALT